MKYRATTISDKLYYLITGYLTKIGGIAWGGEYYAWSGGDEGGGGGGDQGGGDQGGGGGGGDQGGGGGGDQGGGGGGGGGDQGGGGGGDQGGGGGGGGGGDQGGGSGGDQGGGGGGEQGGGGGGGGSPVDQGALNQLYEQYLGRSTAGDTGSSSWLGQDINAVIAGLTGRQSMPGFKR